MCRFLRHMHWLLLVALLTGCAAHQSLVGSRPLTLDLGSPYTSGDTLRYPVNADPVGDGLWYFDIPRFTLMNAADSLSLQRHDQIVAKELTGPAYISLPDSIAGRPDSLVKREPLTLDIGPPYTPGDTLRYPVEADTLGNGLWYFDVPRFTLMSAADSLPFQLHGQIVAQELTGSAYISLPDSIAGRPDVYVDMTIDRLCVERLDGLFSQRQSLAKLGHADFMELVEKDRQAHYRYQLP